MSVKREKLHDQSWPLAVGPSCPPPNSTLTVSTASVSALIWCPPAQVSNAIKFSKRGGEEIRVSLVLEEMEVSCALVSALSRHECVDEASTEELRAELCKRPLGSVRVTVSVADSGHGVPEEHQANLFKAYMQIDAGKIQKSKGTGLGLSVSKSIMELHAGQVGFRPEPQGGSKFFFTLPMAVHVMPEEESRGSRPAAHSTEKGSSSTHLPVPGSPSEGARVNLAEMVPGPGGASHDHPASLVEPEEQIVAVHSGAHPSGRSAGAPSQHSSRPTPAPALAPTASPVREWPLSVSATQPATASTAAITDESNLFVPARPPFPDSPLAVSATPRASPSSRPLGPPVAPGARVLVVEDSAPNRRLLQKLLTRMGCVTSAAENGEECLRYFDNAPAAGLPPSHPQQQHQPFDLVLMVSNRSLAHSPHNFRRRTAHLQLLSLLSQLPVLTFYFALLHFPTAFFLVVCRTIPCR